MKIKVNNIVLSPEERPDTGLAARVLNIPFSKVKDVKVMKQSVDARRKNNLRFVYSLLVETEDGLNIKETADISVFSAEKRDFVAKNKYEIPPVVVGMGPAGLFCGYILAKYGYRPLIIEQGKNVDERTADVEAFKKGGNLMPYSNIQFGEGGAGTFSDGKLTTRINDFHCSEVLETLHKFGAPEEILYKAKPHIGTDILREVVKNMRLEIERLGGTVLFNSKLTAISHKGKVESIKINGQTMPCQALVLAIGHSSRDTFDMLLGENMIIEPKPFAVGVRIEHTQDFINIAQYGDAAGKYGLPAAEYFLKYNGDKHSCYSFCMCPGGEIVPATSEQGLVVTNGMSEFARNGKYANSGIVVSLSPEDFGNSPLSGVNFQKNLEEKAYKLGGANYSAPGQYAKDFINSEKTTGDIYSTYSRGVTGCDLNKLFPEFICRTMKEGLQNFDRKIPGFAGDKVPLVGIESRTSSPVRITRGEDMQSLSIKGVYPCGEGAGYAGGIVSAAVDGIKVARKIMGDF